MTRSETDLLVSFFEDHGCDQQNADDCGKNDSGCGRVEPHFFKWRGIGYYCIDDQADHGQYADGPDPAQITFGD